MAKGQYLSSYQRGIVRRFYQHRDTILVTRLQEAAGEAFLAEGKAADRAWKRIADSLAKLRTEPPLDPARWQAIVEQRDAAALAALVNSLAGTN